MRSHTAFCAALLFGLQAGPVCAHDYAFGTLQIGHPWIRATVPAAPVSGGYLTIANKGGEPDRLLSGSADFALKFEIHEMKMEGDIMKMRPLAGGLEIMAGGEIELAPGGLHVMFSGLKEQLKPGEMRKATLEFEKAGKVEIEFKVEAMGAEAHTGHTN